MEIYNRRGLGDILDALDNRLGDDVQRAQTNLNVFEVLEKEDEDRSVV